MLRQDYAVWVYLGSEIAEDVRVTHDQWPDGIKPFPGSGIDAAQESCLYRGDIPCPHFAVALEDLGHRSLRDASLASKA
jgi:hypothetical protein